MKTSALLKTISLLAAVSTVAACTNITVPESSNPTGGTSGNDESGQRTAAATGDGTSTYRISSININGSGTDTNYTTTVLFDAGTSPGPVSVICTAGKTANQNSKPCLCEFSWKELNDSSGSAVYIPHKVQTSVATVQPQAVTCPAPQIYATEIPVGTTIQIRVIPAAANTEKFDVPWKPYKKTGTSGGAFTDDKGNIFDNVVRYSCYEQYQRGMKVINKVKTVDDTSSNARGKAIFVQATQFCIAKIAGGGSGEGCDNMPDPQNSAQANYFNFYIPKARAGEINESNSRFVCPKVREALDGGTLVGDKGAFWPLDQSFALAVRKGPDFSVGVVANATLNRGSDTSSTSETCEAASGSTGGSDSTGESSPVATRCLGFAARPAADGTCKNIVDQVTGQTRQTFRLRRFHALYPPVFDSDGKMNAKFPQMTDTVYVLDRPVLSPAGNEYKTYTMLGPKPCPFAYYDAQSVTGVGTQGYYGTNDPKWDHTNIDGIMFPNTDSKDDKTCAAVIPMYDWTNNRYYIGTTESGNTNNPIPDIDPKFKMDKVYIRPMNAWAPHYIEDTSFQACAPLADPVKDPPLHFYKTDGNQMAYCAETYPTQNPYVAHSKPWTSHIVDTTNSQSPGCAMTEISGKHNTIGGDALKTCDRTVSMAGLSWSSFPLLAPADKVSDALSKNFAGYGCTVTYDNGGTKTGKFSPSGGCCGTSVTPANTKDAHLEPGTACQTPAY